MVDRVPAFPARLKENRPREGFATDAEYKVLAANAKELWRRALIACAYSFGFRKGELLNLHVRQVDLLDRWIELEEGTTKTARLAGSNDSRSFRTAFRVLLWQEARRLRIHSRSWQPGCGPAQGMVRFCVSVLAWVSGFQRSARMARSSTAIGG